MIHRYPTYAGVPGFTPPVVLRVLWDFVVEVSFGAGGGSFKSVCIFGGSDFFVLTLDFVV